MRPKWPFSADVRLVACGFSAASIAGLRDAGLRHAMVARYRVVDISVDPRDERRRRRRELCHRFIKKSGSH